MRGWLASVVSGEVRRLRRERDAEKAASGVMVQLWAKQIGESRRANDRAEVATEHLAHALDRRDDALERMGRYRLAWLSAGNRARRMSRAHALLVECTDDDFSALVAQRDEARAEVVKLGREVDRLRRTIAAQENVIARLEGRPEEGEVAA